MLRNWLSALALAIQFGISCEPASAEAAVRIVDGDGLRIEGQSIRLWGIDAPELDQTCEQDGRATPCGEDARLLLGALAQSGEITCETEKTDRYGRTVARCFAGGLDLAGAMVRQGYALDWPRYSDGFYSSEEAEARVERRGMWAGR
ncbi:MAG: thermonuclease family protein [Henriciella sp.]|uniref:thermonuclease family protein n=1 Tax=Henriciella sp. TaxID=1968823 RepID=UPI003C713833